MPFLDNMPSRKAASFSLLVSGEASTRGQSRHQRAQQYMALNDTRPPEGQVIGMCLGHSVLGHDWHQQQLHPPSAKQPAFTRAVPHSGGGGSSHGHPQMLASSTPPSPSPRAAAAAAAGSAAAAGDSSTHSANTGFRRERGGGDGGGGGGSSSGRATAVRGELDNHSSAAQEDDGMGEFARSDRGESGDKAQGDGRGVRGRKAVPADRLPSAATMSSDDAAEPGRRSARAWAAAGVAMDEGACSTTADEKSCDEAPGLTKGAQGESLPGQGVAGAGLRAVAAWSGRSAGSTSGRARREERAWTFGEGVNGDERAAEQAPAVTNTRGRVGMKKARRTYGR